MFRLKSKNHLARRGELQTVHGLVQTPFFMPIATKGAVKTLSMEDLRTLGAEIILSNTYHLMLRPGLEAMQKLGGFHALTAWDRALLTDSGGYQVFSLPNKTTEDGVEFKSVINGDKHFLTPEASMQMQAAIGADICMQFDDVASGTSTRERYEEAMERSLRWAERSKSEIQKIKSETNPKSEMSQNQKIFAIVQGGTHEDLRARSADALVKMDFDGYAIGGLSVGEDRADAYRIAAFTAARLPEDKPRYFMGGGFPEEIVYYVSIGVDMFDCVLPTRNARHGTVFLWKEDPSICVPRALRAAQQGARDVEVAAILYDQVHLSNEKYTFDTSPLDPWISPDTSKAYLRHLFLIQEPLAARLATLQNIGFYLRLMQELRRTIEVSA